MSAKRRSLVDTLLDAECEENNCSGCTYFWEHTFLDARGHVEFIAGLCSRYQRYTEVRCADYTEKRKDEEDVSSETIS